MRVAATTQEGEVVLRPMAAATSNHGRQGVSSADLTVLIKKYAAEIGFHSVGVVSAKALQARRPELIRWLSAGYAGKLGYMDNFLERERKLLLRFPELKSILVLVFSYARQGKKTDSEKSSFGFGRVARYAQGRDYHRVLQKRLKKLEGFLSIQVKRPLQAIRCVDTAPIQERALAEMAGLGFIGKNTCFIVPKGGSFYFLSALLTDVELVADEPIAWDCGSCTLCLKACPTQALVRPYELDARRCISYLTIELKEAIEPTLRPLMKDWIFGCDICQDVCPYNRTAVGEDECKENQFSLEKILSCRTESAFIGECAGTPLMRAKREGLLRNTVIAAGNQKDPAAVPALSDALMRDSSFLVRQHAAWALGRIGGSPAQEALKSSFKTEENPAVLQEIKQALQS